MSDHHNDPRTQIQAMIGCLTALATLCRGPEEFASEAIDLAVQAANNRGVKDKDHFTRYINEVGEIISAVAFRVFGTRLNIQFAVVGQGEALPIFGGKAPRNAELN